MSYYQHVLASNSELYHYGVKGMKWGVRKQKRLETRAISKYQRAGERYGQADYYRRMGAEDYKKYDAQARAYDKIARKRDKNGNYRLAASARNTAQRIRAKGEILRSQREDVAYRLEKDADKLQEKASKFATKKRITLGKSKVDSIINGSKKRGSDLAAIREERERKAMQDYYISEAFDTAKSTYEYLRNGGS